MPTITTAERTRYADIWDNLPLYGSCSPGLELLPLFQELATPPATVLDAGCGTGKAGVALAALGYRVTLCDLTDAGLVPEARALPFRSACLWKPLRPQLRLGQIDWVFCADVMEHLPTQFTMLAVDQMLALAEQGVLLSICLVPDAFGVLTGGPLHLTVQSFVWWRDALRELGTVVDARDCILRGIYLMTRRQG